MNIALIGYGKMGRAIEQIAVQRGHAIVLKIRSDNEQDVTTPKLHGCDVAIEFTQPATAPVLVKRCLDAGIPVVSGTTGWNGELDELKAGLKPGSPAFIHASNFSVGVNLFFEINRLVAKMLAEQSSYRPSITEIHHTAKKDAPSGTAIVLAEDLVAERTDKQGWSLNNMNDPKRLPVFAHREDSVPGTHNVLYHSTVDDIAITHTAHNRDGFALGAVMAAEFIAGKTGVFTMKDVLGLWSAEGVAPG